MNTKELLSDLTTLTKDLKDQAERMMDLSDEDLNRRPSAESWSALECIEHLNRYGNYYVPELESRVEDSEHKPKFTFKPGFLGRYFVNSMKPAGKIKKMRALKSMNPINSDIDKSVIDTFIDHQNRLLDVLKKSYDVDLTKTKTGISIAPWYRLRLGDTLQVVIYHNQRHMIQAQNSIASQP